MEATAKVAAARHEAGELDDSQFTALDEIIVQARQGDWAGAEQAAIRLAKAQRAGEPAATP